MEPCAAYCREDGERGRDGGEGLCVEGGLDRHDHAVVLTWLGSGLGLGLGLGSGLGLGLDGAAVVLTQGRGATSGLAQLETRAWLGLE